MPAATGAGATKIATGTVGGGTALYAVLAGLGEVPVPEGHTVMDVAVMALGVYLVTLIYKLQKSGESKEAAMVQSAATMVQTNPPREEETVVSWLKRISEDVRDGNEKLNEHRGDFREFRGEITARVSALERKINRNTGEIQRP